MSIYLPPMPAGPERPVWCPRCQTHYAQPKQLCPICLDEDTRTARATH